jgi:hypothetical protein
MNAQEMIDELIKIANHHSMSLSDLEINYRIDFDSDIEEINWICEDSYDQETNSILKSVTLFCDNTGLEEEE